MSVINILFPRVRAELIRLLFLDPTVELHLRELMRLSLLSIGTIQPKNGTSRVVFTLAGANADEVWVAPPQ